MFDRLPALALTLFALAGTTVAQVRFHAGAPGAVDGLARGATCFSSDLGAMGTLRPGATPGTFQPGVWTPTQGFTPVGDPFDGPWVPTSLNAPRVTWVADDGDSAILSRALVPAHSSTHRRAYLWERGQGLTPFAILPGGTSHAPVHHMSQDHGVAYGLHYTASGFEFVRWDDVTTVARVCDAIPGLPCNAEVVGLTPDGEASVAWANSLTFSRLVFHHREGGPVSVVFDGGWANPDRSCISADGVHVAHQVPAGSGLREVRIWSEGGALRSLGTFPSSFGTMSLDQNGQSLLRRSTGDLWIDGVGWTHVHDRLVAAGASMLAYVESFTGARVNQASAASPDFTSFLVTHQAENLVAHLGEDRFGTIGFGSCGPTYENSGGTATGLWLLGSKRVLDNDLTLLATRVPPGEVGMAIHSIGATFVTNPGGSWGHLCLGGGHPVGRFNRPGELGLGQTDGTLEIEVDLTNLPLPNGTTFASPGDTWGFQVWYRDRHPGSGAPISHFTEAAWVTFE